MPLTNFLHDPGAMSDNFRYEAGPAYCDNLINLICSLEPAICETVISGLSRL
jgi:hypothetical protein